MKTRLHPRQVDSPKLEELQTEIARLKAGRFTEEEFQNLCHSFEEDDRNRFCNGCENYHRNLFGSSPITELRNTVVRLKRGDFLPEEFVIIAEKLKSVGVDVYCEVCDQRKGISGWGLVVEGLKRLWIKN